MTSKQCGLELQVIKGEEIILICPFLMPWGTWGWDLVCPWCSPENYQPPLRIMWLWTWFLGYFWKSEEGDSTRNDTSHQNSGFLSLSKYWKEILKITWYLKDPAQTSWLAQADSLALPKHSGCPLALPWAFLRDNKHMLLRMGMFET